MGEWIVACDEAAHLREETGHKRRHLSGFWPSAKNIGKAWEECVERGLYFVWRGPALHVQPDEEQVEDEEGPGKHGPHVGKHTNTARTHAGLPPNSCVYTSVSFERRYV